MRYYKVDMAFYVWSDNEEDARSNVETELADVDADFEWMNTEISYR